MVEIEANKEIKNIKQEYFMGLGLREIVLGVISIAVSAVVYMILPFTDIIKGYICMVIVIILMFLFNYKLSGMTLFQHLLCVLKSLSYANKPLVYKDEIKDRRRIKKNDQGND